MEEKERPEPIDRKHAIKVLQKLIDARCECHRSAAIEIQAFKMAQEVLRQLPIIIDTKE